MSCNIGVSTNRFLAKLAASLHKPNGLDVIEHTNILDVYKRVSLLDLNGINTRFQARLNAYGIFTPTEFYQAPLDKLKKQVFQSILGYYWYLRLRGHEIDAIDFGQKLRQYLRARKADQRPPRTGKAPYEALREDRPQTAQSRLPPRAYTFPVSTRIYPGGISAGSLRCLLHNAGYIVAGAKFGHATTTLVESQRVKTSMIVS